jgi:hypothetical protein
MSDYKLEKTLTKRSKKLESELKHLMKNPRLHDNGVVMFIQSHRDDIMADDAAFNSVKRLSDVVREMEKYITSESNVVSKIKKESKAAAVAGGFEILGIQIQTGHLLTFVKAIKDNMLDNGDAVDPSRVLDVAMLLAPIGKRKLMEVSELKKASSSS